MSAARCVRSLSPYTAEAAKVKQQAMVEAEAALKAQEEAEAKAKEEAAALAKDEAALRQGSATGALIITPTLYN